MPRRRSSTRTRTGGRCTCCELLMHRCEARRRMVDGDMLGLQVMHLARVDHDVGEDPPLLDG